MLLPINCEVFSDKLQGTTLYCNMSLPINTATDFLFMRTELFIRNFRCCHSLEAKTLEMLQHQQDSEKEKKTDFT